MINPSTPLTSAERRQLNNKLKRLPPSTARELKAGVECLPKATQDRALYDWAMRTPIPSWLK